MNYSFVLSFMLAIMTASCSRLEVVRTPAYKEISAAIFQRVAMKRGADCEKNTVRFLPYSKCYYSEYDASDMPELDRVKASFQNFRISELNAEENNESGDSVLFSYTCVYLKAEEGYEFWSASIPIEEGTPDCLDHFDGVIQYWFVRPLNSDIVYYIQAAQ